MPAFVPVSSKGTVALSSNAYEIGTSAGITVGDLDLNGNPSCSVTVTSSAGDSETVTLAAQGGGMFAGSVPTSAGTVAVGDGTLETVAGGTITVTYNDANDGTGHPAVVTAQATTYRVDHYTFTAISSPQTAGAPFSVTATAYDTTNNPITGYNGTVSLTASGQGGALAISPTSVTFASGVWTGNVTVSALDPAVTLKLSNAAGAIGTSSVFATQPGPVASFQSSTIASPQSQNVAFPVTLTAKDANGYTATGYNGTATLSGAVGSTTTAMLMGEPTPDWSGNYGTYTLGYSFTPSATITVTDVLHYFGSKISIWTDSGTLVASQTFALAGAGWMDTPLAAPVTLAAGTTYRIGDYSSAQTYYRWTTASHVSPLGTLGQDYDVSGDGFPTSSYGDDWWAVDLLAQVGSSTSVPITSVTATFVNGTWTGSVSVAAATTVSNAATVSLYTPSSSLIGTFTVSASQLGYTFSSGQFVYNGPATVGKAVVRFNSTAAPRFVFDNLSFGAVTDDWYSINSPAAGSTLSLATSTPAAGSGEFANSLSPHIELYDPSGNLVASGTVGADGRNETINYTPAVAGVFRIHVNAKSGTQGEYFLKVGAPVNLVVPTNATEGDGTVAGTLGIPAALATDLVVSLTSSDANRVTVPATETIPAGQTTFAWPITIIDDNLLNGPEAVTIAASAPGYAPVTGTITVHDNETATLSVTLPASAHEKGGSVSGTVTASAPPTQNITVQLASGDTTRLTVPATVTLPAGQTTVNFTATLLDDHVIEPGPTPVTVTSQVENWTSGAATINILDDDNTMAITLPASGWEGQTLSGTVQLGGSLTTPLVVSLSSSDTTELTLPATVTIAAGATSAPFTATLVANGLRTGPKTVQVTASAGSLPTATASTVVNDSDADHYGFSTIATPEAAGAAFSVTVRAYDILNDPITVYNGTVPLSGMGQGGALSVTPGSVTFASGVWTGSVTVNGVDPGMALHLDNGAGATGASNVFAVQGGPVTSLQWSAIASTEYQGFAIPATLTAKDARGYPSTGFSGTASLSGMAPGLIYSTVLGQPVPNNSSAIGTWTLGYSFTPRACRSCRSPTASSSTPSHRGSSPAPSTKATYRRAERWSTRPLSARTWTPRCSIWVIFRWSASGPAPMRPPPSPGPIREPSISSSTTWRKTPTR